MKPEARRSLRLQVRHQGARRRIVVIEEDDAEMTTLTAATQPVKKIDPGHRHLAGKADDPTLSGRNRGVDLRAAPVALPLQQPDREEVRDMSMRAQPDDWKR